MPLEGYREEVHLQAAGSDGTWSFVNEDAASLVNEFTFSVVDLSLIGKTAIRLLEKVDYGRGTPVSFIEL